jgi:hypothetical protein
MAENTADRVKQVAAEEVEKVKHLTQDAVQSKAYLYPLKVHTDLCLVNEMSDFGRACTFSSPTETCGSH